MKIRSLRPKEILTASLGWWMVFLLLLPAVLASKIVTTHPDRGTPKILYPSLQETRDVTNPKDRAYAYLYANSPVFGLPADLSNLELVRVQESLLGNHFHFQQFINKIPVEFSEIIVSVNHTTKGVYQIFNNTYPKKVRHRSCR